MREKIPIGPRTSKEQSLSYFVKIINFKMEFFIFTKPSLIINEESQIDNSSFQLLLRFIFKRIGCKLYL
ncbi:unnamed protein product [Rhizophagus irregularis]|nr:unnamed protein product [Rhizophagus irregularis]